MLIDEIKSKIALINISSDHSYTTYVKQMIDSLPNSKEKMNLLLQYANKMNELTMIRQGAFVSDNSHNEIEALTTFDESDNFIVLYSNLLFSNKSFELYKVNKITDNRYMRNLNGKSR